MILVVLALLVTVGGVAFALGRHTAPKSAAVPTQTQTAANDAGKAVFASAGCGSCHTLRDAGATGAVGPNLDQAHPSRALVAIRVKNGKGGMPSFARHLTPEQLANVADYVSSVAGK